MNRRLRILVVSPYQPSRRSGGPVRLRGLVSSLSAGHSVSLLSFVSGRDPRADTTDLRDRFDEVISVPNHAFGGSRASKRFLQARSLVSGRSFERIAHEAPAFQAELDRLEARSSFDLVQVEHCFMWHYRFPRTAAVVLDEHNVEYEIRGRTASVTGAGARKVYDYINHLKLQREERRAWNEADACATTSPRDEATVRAASPSALTAVVPNGVDTEHFTASSANPDPSTVLFFGSLDYYPNVDALLFFLRDVMPLLRRSHPSAHLRIVGRGVPPVIQRWAGPDVTVTGFVEDVRPQLDRATVVVAPLRIGGGTRLKILEAMAMAKPVVSTTIGAEGLAVRDGRDLLVADDPTALAAQIGRVLDDPELAKQLGEGGRRLVEARYDWKSSGRALEALFDGAMRARLARQALKAVPHLAGTPPSAHAR